MRSFKNSSLTVTIAESINAYKQYELDQALYEKPHDKRVHHFTGHDKTLERWEFHTPSREPSHQASPSPRYTSQPPRDTSCDTRSGMGSLENFPHLAHTTPELRVDELDSEVPRWGIFSREPVPDLASQDTWRAYPPCADQLETHTLCQDLHKQNPEIRDGYSCSRTAHRGNAALY